MLQPIPGDKDRREPRRLVRRVDIDFGVYGVPETFVIDQKGTIRYKHIGPLREDALKEKILPLVERLSRG